MSQIAEEKVRVGYQLAQWKNLRERSPSPVVFYQAVLQLHPGEEILPGLLRDLNTCSQMLARLREDYASEQPRSAGRADDL